MKNFFQLIGLIILLALFTNSDTNAQQNITGKLTVTQTANSAAAQFITPRFGVLVDNSYTSTATNSYSLLCRNNGSAVFQVFNNGKVKIGDVSFANANVGNYKLFVKDGILTERVRIAEYDSAKWADFVFANDYQLNSLEMVEFFVQNNKHLPNVPSAQEVAKKGFDLADMDATLLRQIEELWLHTIELNKTNKSLEEVNEDLIQSNQQLNAQYNLLLQRIEKLEAQK